MRLLRVFLSVGGLQLAVMLVLLVRTKGLALILGPEQYGLMAAMDRLVAVFAQTASLSLPFAALRYLSPLWHDDPQAYRELLRRMTRVLGVGVGVGLAVGLATVWWAPGVLGDEVGGVRVLATLALLTLPVVAFVPFLQNVLASGFAHNRAMTFLLIHAVVFAVGSLVGAAQWGLDGLYALYGLLGTSLVVAVLARLGRAPVRDAPGTPELESTVTSEEVSRAHAYLPARVWRFCLLLLPSSFLAPAVAYAIFLAVLTGYGEGSAGYMQAAIGISLAVRGTLGAANQVFLTPMVNRSGGFEERVGRVSAYQRALLLLVGLVVPPVVLFSGLVVHLLYSASFLPAAPFVAMFVVVEILALVTGVYQALLVAMDRIVAYVSQTVLAQLALYGLAVVAIPRLGIAGAALAGLGSQVVLLIATVAYLGRRYGLHVPRCLMGLGLYVFAILVGAGALSLRFPGIGLTELGAKVLFYGVAVVILSLFLRPEDWSSLRNMARTVLPARQRSQGSGE